MSNQYSQYSVCLYNVSDDYLRYLLNEERLSDVYNDDRSEYDDLAYAGDNPHDFGEWEIWTSGSPTGNITVHLYANEYLPNMEAVNRVIQKYLAYEGEADVDSISYVSVSYGDNAIPDYQGATVYVVTVDDVKYLTCYQVAELLEKGMV